MPGWTLIDTHPTGGRTFQRPLSAPEHGFFLDSCFFKGTTDSIQHFELHLSNGARDADLFSKDNIIRAWLSTKRRHPLIGAIVQEHDLGIAAGSKANESGRDHRHIGLPEDLYYVVREHDLSRLRPNEIVFGYVASAEEAQQRALAILAGPCPLSAELLVRLYAFQENRSGKPREDVLHLMILTGHCVADWTAIWMLMRCLLDTLARGRESTELAQMPLEDRLAMVVPVTELEPMHIRALSPAIRRWRRAIGAVIFQLRMGKMQGGHTLPCRLTRSTPHTAARPALAAVTFTRAQKVAVIANCRQHNITFGNALNVLAQVAMTRFLYRLYLHGEMSEEEWEYRKKQPYTNGSPVNLRSYLDKKWFERGGGGEFTLSMGFFHTLLPPLSLDGMDDRRSKHCEHDRKRTSSKDAPPFSDLLTFDQFLHRTALIKKQTTSFLNHPLFLEIVHAGEQEFSEMQRLGALERIRLIKNGDPDGRSEKDETLGITDDPIWANLGSSLGNVDSVFPSEYPLPSTHALSPYCPISHPVKAGYVIPPAPPLPLASEADVKPKIVVRCVKTRLHTRPAELYIGALTSLGQLKMTVSYDGNVFEEGVVSEWLNEVREAVLWYLGCRVNHSGDVQAKL